MKPYKFSRRELQILELFAAGYNYLQTAGKLGISLNNLHNYASRLHKKTGINLKSQKDVYKFISTYTPQLIPTDMQQQVLCLLAKGLDYHQISTKLHISHGTAMNHASAGRKRMGIRGAELDSMYQLRKTLGARLELRSHDPMDDPLF